MDKVPTADEMNVQIWNWWNRIHEIAPWSWQSDPYLVGLDEETFLRLRDVDWADE